MKDHGDNKPAQGRFGRWTFNTRFLVGAPGNPMMERWRLIQTPLFGIYVHFIYREDLDPVPHDHPWRFWSWVLRGGYVEWVRDDVRVLYEDRWESHARWSFHGFPLRSAHRITRVEPNTVTLVFVGRKLRTWGFYEDDGHFVDYRDALHLRTTEGVVSTGKYPRDWNQQIRRDAVTGTQLNERVVPDYTEDVDVGVAVPWDDPNSDPALDLGNFIRNDLGMPPAIRCDDPKMHNPHHAAEGAFCVGRWSDLPPQPVDKPVDMCPTCTSIVPWQRFVIGVGQHCSDRWHDRPAGGFDEACRVHWYEQPCPVCARHLVGGL